jgi:hypothetical protein
LQDAAMIDAEPVERAETLNKKLDAETKSEVSILNLALEVIRKRLGLVK